MKWSVAGYGCLVNFLTFAEQFIEAQFPTAAIAVLAGSTARRERTATSDIDLLLIGEDLFEQERSRTAMATTRAYAGEVFEIFAYTPAGFAEWAERDLAQHRPVIVRMLIDGIPIRDDGSLATLRAQWRTSLDLGPRIDDAELAFRRYVITDLLDDLRDSTSPIEIRVLEGLLYERIAELILLSGGEWIGSGKWLPRRLAAFDAMRATALSTPLLAGDHAGFAERVAAELDACGGRMQDGMVR